MRTKRLTTLLPFSLPHLRLPPCVAIAACKTLTSLPLQLRTASASATASASPAVTIHRQHSRGALDFLKLFPDRNLPKLDSNSKINPKIPSQIQTENFFNSRSDREPTVIISVICPINYLIFKAIVDLRYSRFWPTLVTIQRHIWNSQCCLYSMHCARSLPSLQRTGYHKTTCNESRYGQCLLLLSLEAFTLSALNSLFDSHT